MIDAGCDVNRTIRVRHAGVVLKHLKIEGADEQQGKQYPSAA